MTVFTTKSSIFGSIVAQPNFKSQLSSTSSDILELELDVIITRSVFSVYSSLDASHCGRGVHQERRIILPDDFYYFKDLHLLFRITTGLVYLVQSRPIRVFLVR